MVLRKYEGLPEEVPDKDGSFDIDILVHPEDKNSAMDVVSKLGFSSGTGPHGSKKNSIYLKGLKNPVKSLKYMVKKPGKSKRMIVNKDSIRDYKFHYNQDGLLLDFVTEIRYKSPTGGMIRVSPFIREMLLERKALTSGLFYSPSVADELVHLVSHCLFDREGYFSDYYKHRCNTLMDRITQSQDLREKTDELLKITFFDANDLIFSELKEKNYTGLYEELMSFSDY